MHFEISSRIADINIKENSDRIVTIRVKEKAVFKIRVPGWVKTETIKLRIDGKESEIILDDINNGTNFNYLFNHCLIKVDSEFSTADPTYFQSIITNKDPKFKNPYNNNYQLDTLSIAKDSGDPDIGVLFPLDIELNNRTIDSAPDLGAYERMENK